VRVRRSNILTGNTSTMEIDVSPMQIFEWQNGKLIQDAMPNVSAEEREFIMTGIRDKAADEDVL
jgi:hypothetical protein